MSATKTRELYEADQRARDEATRVFEGPFLLEAGAGTGKTATLVARVVSWSIGLGWERTQAALAERSDSDVTAERIAGRVLDGIVAITFTEAAAAEMATRVDQGLATVEAGETLLGLPADGIDSTSEEVRERASQLRSSIERLTVCTIHSFCRRLLAENPLELGIDPGFQVDADGRASAELLRQAIEIRLREAFTAKDPDPDHVLLAARGKSPSDLQEALEALLDAGATPNDLAESPWTETAIVELSHRLKALFHEWSEVHAEPLAGISKVAKTEIRLRNALNEELVFLVDEFEGTTPAELTTFTETLLEKLGEDNVWKKLGDWSAGTWSKSLLKVVSEEEDLSAFATWAGALREALEVLKTFDHELFEASRRVLGVLLGDVQRGLRQRGILTFTDLLTHAEKLLRENAEVRLRVRNNLDQLLVDEFQDTDPLQCSIIRSLMQTEPGQEAQAPGLFLVGDPKQSIYGFRRADLGAYDAFKAEITQGSEHVYRLDVNHRSFPWILDEVQRCIAPSMEREEGIQPEFQPLLPSPKREAAQEADRFPKKDGAPHGVEHWLIWNREADENDLPLNLKSAESSELEGQLVTADLLRLKASGEITNWAEVGLLFRTLGHVEPLLLALREAGIPYDVSGDKSYYRRREIRDISSIVRAVLDPTDHLALIAALRSSFCGVPDAAWAPLWAANFPDQMSRLLEPTPESLLEIDAVLQTAAKNIPAELDEDALVEGWVEAAKVAVRVLAELRSDFARLPADRFVERLRTLTAFEVTESARYLGAYRVANLEIFYAELLDALEEGAGDAHAVLRTLRRQLTAGHNAAEGRPQEAERDAVRIFTVHKSKGLEFKHVYLLQTHRQPKASRRPSLDVAPRGADVRGFEFLWFGAASPGWCAAYARREKREAAERVRNLYVALTRAEERLVVSGAWPPLKPSKNKDPQRTPKGWEAARSFCDLLYAREDGIGDPESAYITRARAEREEETRIEKQLGYDVPGAHIVIPSSAPKSDATEYSSDDAETLALPSGKEFLRCSEALRERREHAAAVQALPYDDSPSSDASEAVLLGSTSADETSGIDRRLAQRIGTEVHRILEQLELESDEPGEALDAARRRSTESADCLKEVDEILGSFRESPLFERLCGEASDRVIARELPCLLEPTAEDRARGVISGVMDLVLQNTETGAYTIVDYKTDRVATDGQPLAERYSSQLALYSRALKSSLLLSEDPKCELWYLRTGETHELSPTGA